MVGMSAPKFAGLWGSISLSGCHKVPAPVPMSRQVGVLRR